MAGRNDVPKYKRGQTDKRTVEEALVDLVPDDGSEFVAGPTNRNTVGNTKRAAAKATGAMGASKKLDPDLKMADAAKHLLSGSPEGVRNFDEVPPKRAAGRVRKTLANAEIAAGTTRTARTGPASRAARTEGAWTGGGAMREDTRTGSLKQRVPAPGTAVNAPKGTLVRGHPTATQSGGRSQSSTGDEKPPKRSARAGTTSRRPISKRSSQERE